MGGVEGAFGAAVVPFWVNVGGLARGANSGGGVNASAPAAPLTPWLGAAEEGGGAVGLLVPSVGDEPRVGVCTCCAQFSIQDGCARDCAPTNFVRTAVVGAAVAVVSG